MSSLAGPKQGFEKLAAELRKFHSETNSTYGFLLPIMAKTSTSLKDNQQIQQGSIWSERIYAQMRHQAIADQRDDRIHRVIEKILKNIEPLQAKRDTTAIYNERKTELDGLQKKAEEIDTAAKPKQDEFLTQCDERLFYLNKINDAERMNVKPEEINKFKIKLEETKKVLKGLVKELTELSKNKNQILHDLRVLETKTTIREDIRGITTAQPLPKSSV